MKIVIISSLLAMPTGQFMSRFYNCIVQQQAILYSTNEAIEYSKTEIKNAIKSTTEPIQSVGTMLTGQSKAVMAIIS